MLTVSNLILTYILAENAFSTQNVEYLQTMATLASILSMVQEGPTEFRYL